MAYNFGDIFKNISQVSIRAPVITLFLAVLRNNIFCLIHITTFNHNTSARSANNIVR